MANIIERGTQRKSPTAQVGRRLVCAECETVFELTEHDKITMWHHPFVGDEPYHYAVKCPLCSSQVDFWGLTIDHGLRLASNNRKREHTENYDYLKKKVDGLKGQLGWNWAFTVAVLLGLIFSVVALTG